MTEETGEAQGVEGTEDAEAAAPDAVAPEARMDQGLLRAAERRAQQDGHTDTAAVVRALVAAYVDGEVKVGTDGTVTADRSKNSKEPRE